ncbi:sulfatase [Negadavirga shengliensis]|uniref:Sulfatase n=1 Tax=Negadavirga shengliensis TaxID=1389218 RepID=A0ABV9SXC1_9BACT
MIDAKPEYSKYGHRKGMILNFFLIILFSLTGPTLANDAVRPNFVILLSDDHGADDVGFSGNMDVSTPVLDQLSREGVTFKRAFAPASVCTPSRSAIYTGLYPYRNGCHQNHGGIKPEITTLPHYLMPLGYRVVLAGKVHVAPKESFPFEYIEKHEIPHFLETVGDTPFCLIVGYYSPHEPYFNKKSGVAHSKITPKPWMPDTKETRMLTAGYYDNVENLDYEIGTSLYWLEKGGFIENSMIIYTSDHGPGLPFGKWTLYEKALHVPFIVKWKGINDPGRQSDVLVSLTDILPTIIELAEGRSPVDLDGKSILPHIVGKGENLHHEYLYAAYTNLGVQEANRYPIRSVRNGRYKLIINANYSSQFTIRMTQRPDNRAVICGYRVLESWRKTGADPLKRYRQFRSRPMVELYDLQNDPHEMRNLAELAEYREVKDTMMTRLRNWVCEQNDTEYVELLGCL